MRRRVWGLGLAAALAGLGGCGERSADLSGTVTYRGKPVTSGTVQVVQGGGKVAYGPIDPDGRYAVAGAVPGAGKVGVSSPDPRRLQAAEPGGGRGKAAPPKAAADPTWVKLPDKYADPDTSGLSTTLTGGANTLDIKLAD